MGFGGYADKCDGGGAIADQQVKAVTMVIRLFFGLTANYKGFEIDVTQRCRR